MSLLDGGSKSPLPSMSWDSVVNDGDTKDATAAPTGDTPDPTSDTADTPADAPGERAAASTAPSRGLPAAPMFHVTPPSWSTDFDDAGSTDDNSTDDDGEDATARTWIPGELLSKLVTTDVPMIDASISAPIVTDDQPPSAPTPSAPEPDAPSDGHADGEPATLSEISLQVPTTTVVSGRVDAIKVPPLTNEQPVVDDDALPPIVEAAPPMDLTARTQAVVAAPDEASGANAVVEATPAPAPAAAPAPAPSAPAAAASLPAVGSLPSAAAATLPSVQSQASAQMFQAVENPRDVSAIQKSGPKTKRRGGFGLILVLLVLAALVAAAIVFGRPYLFPEEWDESAKAYGEDIEAVRGIDFEDPLMVISEPTADYRARVGDQLLGSWEAQMPLWRAFGVAAGGTERSVLDSLIVDRSPAIYSTVDGQVYHDAALATVDLDPAVTYAMAVAALDQELLFTARQGRRNMLDAAMVEAHVHQQASSIQERSNAPMAIRPTDAAPLAFLPPVLDYQLVAPMVFAELLPPIDDVASNPLADIGSSGPGPLFDAPLPLATTVAPLNLAVDPAPAAEPVGGEEPAVPTEQPVVDPPVESVPADADATAETSDGTESTVGTTRVVDRSFLYLAFASHLDGATAYAMTSDLQAASITEVRVGERTCFDAVFESETPELAAVLDGQLAAWASNVAPELSASSQSLADGASHLRTCDPGDAFTSQARFGVARELIGWHAAELATITHVVESGGDQAALTVALGQLSRSSIATDLASLGATTSPSELASAAEAAVSNLLAPSAPTDS